MHRKSNSSKEERNGSAERGDVESHQNNREEKYSRKKAIQQEDGKRSEAKEKAAHEREENERPFEGKTVGERKQRRERKKGDNASS